MEKINLLVDGRAIEVNSDRIRLNDLASLVEDYYEGHICMAKINNKLYNLNHILYKDSEVEFIDTLKEDGKRLYFRGLSLLLVMACKDLFEEAKVYINHSMSGGLYCVVKKKDSLSDKDIESIKAKMLEYVEKDLTIKCNYLPSDEAIEKFCSINWDEKAELLKYRKDDIIKVYECNGYIDYFYGLMFPSTGHIKDLDLAKMADGLVILGPENGVKGKISKLRNMDKLSEVYRESEEWSRTLGIDNVVDLNRIIESNAYGDMVRTVEALHEKKIAEIADIIHEKKAKLILIAAPSSSGKTSFAHRLSIQLRVIGQNPLPISMDDYFLDRVDTPLDQDGNYDYESMYAIDIPKFEADISQLLEGHEIDEIKFDFIDGKRTYTGKKIRLEHNQTIIIEGIHGLNPVLTESIDNSSIFKIYLSVITQLNLDDHNRIPTTDLRLLRRMVRDSMFRGISAVETMEKWSSVRRGEEKNIFPYAEEADIMFNSAGVYELAVLKTQAMDLLKQVSEDSDYYMEAQRLKSLLQYFVNLDDTGDIGPTAIIREFIGGSRIV